MTSFVHFLSNIQLKKWNFYLFWIMGIRCITVLAFILLRSWFHCINEVDSIWEYVYLTDQFNSQCITAENSCYEQTCSFMHAVVLRVSVNLRLLKEESCNILKHHFLQGYCFVFVNIRGNLFNSWFESQKAWFTQGCSSA